ncbi:MAG: class I SAM-dependent methyltransferase [Candidatus Doudnabacteria bacterium]
MNTYQEEWLHKGNFDLYEKFRRYLPCPENPYLADGIARRGIQEIEALDIGGGSGTSSLEIISFLNAREITVKKWEVVDVSREQLAAFKQKVAHLDSPHFSFAHYSWSEFALRKKYNFVLSLHSWYGINGWREEAKAKNTLRKFTEAISKDGLGVIVITAKDNVMATFSNQIRGGHYRATGNEICAKLSKLGIRFEQETANLPIPALLAAGELTCAAEAIYPFILGMADLSHIRKELTSYLSEWIAVHGEWFSAVDFIWIRK